MNSTSWKRLNGTTMPLEVHKDPTGYVPEGVDIGSGDQLIYTVDTIQVLEVQIVRCPLPRTLPLVNTHLVVLEE